MKEIKDFFDKFNNRAIKEIRKREAIISIIKDLTKTEIKIEDISFNQAKIKIKGSSSFKSTLLIKKTELLKRINEKLGERFVGIE